MCTKVGSKSAFCYCLCYVFALTSIVVFTNNECIFPPADFRYLCHHDGLQILHNKQKG